MLGDFYRTTGDLDKATAEYAALYQEHPKDIQVKKNYTQLLIQKNRFDEARKLNDELLQASPNDNEALVYRGQLQISSGNPNDAIVTLQSVIKNDPNNAAAHYQSGSCVSKVRRSGRAPRPNGGRRCVFVRTCSRLSAPLALLAMRQGDMSRTGRQLPPR